MLRPILIAFVAGFLTHLLGLVAIADWLRPRLVAAIGHFFLGPCLVLVFCFPYVILLVLVAAMVDSVSPFPAWLLLRWLALAAALWIAPFSTAQAVEGFREKHADLVRTSQ